MTTRERCLPASGSHFLAAPSHLSSVHGVTVLLTFIQNCLLHRKLYKWDESIPDAAMA